MKKSIIIFLLILLVSHDTYCMKRHRPSNWHTRKKNTPPKMIKPSGSAAQQNQEPVLSTEIIGKIFLDSFKTEDRTEAITIIREQIITFYLINRKLCAYIQSPNNTRIIMDNATICHGFLKPFIAKNLGLPSILNYVKQTQKLRAEIDTLSIEDIRNLIIQNGADVNYYGSEKFPLLSKTIDNQESPLLLKTIDNYDKTECLMELGADPYLGNLLDKNCAFTEAIKKEKIDFVNLFIKYYPYYRVIQFYNSFKTVIGESSVDLALKAKNIELIKSVLKQKNIPYDKLKKVLWYAYHKDINDLSELLHNQGIYLAGEIG